MTPLAALTLIANGILKDDSDGICINLIMYTLNGDRKFNSMEYVSDCAQDWPAYSGRKSYPIPDPDADSEGDDLLFTRAAASIYADGTDKWTGAYGFLRFSLARHCLDHAVLEAGIY